MNWQLKKNLQVILTSGFNGNVWYQKDLKAKTLTIYGSSDGEVSFRLTGDSFVASVNDNVAHSLNISNYDDMVDRVKVW